MINYSAGVVVVVLFIFLLLLLFFSSSSSSSSSSSASAKWSGFFTESTFDQQRGKETANSLQFMYNQVLELVMASWSVGQYLDRLGIPPVLTNQ